MPSPTESSLEAGLLAFKQGNYHAAITKLEPIANSQSSQKASLQAQVFLVTAYARTGQVAKAIALCNNLTNSKNPQIQDWAKRALEYLQQRQKRQSKSSVSHQLQENAENSNQALHKNGMAGKSTIPPVNIYWRQARRAKIWQPLQKSKSIPSILLALGTLIAILWIWRGIIQFALSVINQILYQLPYLEPVQLFYRDPILFILLLLFILAGFSPWLLDGLLTKFYGQQHLSKETLQPYSREAVRVLQRTCQQKHWPTPQLRILPTAAPLIFVYGSLPRFARITISQGLLAQLADDEIAALYALALGQLKQWDFVVMSLVLVVTLPIYRIYQQASEWGNEYQKTFWRWPATIISSLAYGFWCLFTGTALLTSRYRHYYSDRQAAEITGNPNGLIRALLKIAVGIASDISQQERTNWLVESLNLVFPVSYQQSISLGSIAGRISFESFLMWEKANPYAQWFTINNSHPLIGDRIDKLCQIAQHWHLETELHLNQNHLQIKPQTWLLQIAPWLGVLLGSVLAILFWLIWQIAYAVHLLNLKWIYDDWSYITGCLLIGFSLGTFLRINYLFPDIKTLTAKTNDHLHRILSDPTVLPIDSINVRLVGKLVGRPGIGNSLAQDLILQSSNGLVKLNHIPWLGQSVNPQDWIGRQITVTGWLRRGATPWIDIQTLETQSGKIINSPHPIWSCILAVATQTLGAYVLLKGY
ncbi:MAG TPA: zinc metalloprotease HtpX [Nostocaceae cyanobacterium]|nr:zinc metalloprotease HtpX [Nostocaceae cyanobacterium]